MHLSGEAVDTLAGYLAIRSTGTTLQLDETPRSAHHQQAPAVQDTLDAVQRWHIERVLRECGWRINGVGNAAVRLGVHPNTLRFRIKKLGLAIPDRRSTSARSCADR